MEDLAKQYQTSRMRHNEPRNESRTGDSQMDVDDGLRTVLEKVI